MENLLDDCAESHRWVQGSKVGTGSTNHEHGGHVGGCDDKGGNGRVVGYLGLVLSLSQVEKSQEEGANGFGKDGLDNV